MRMAEITIHLLSCGHISLTREAVLGGAYGLGGALSQVSAPGVRRLSLPCFCYLIEHPKGLILMDTGVGRAFSPKGQYDAAAVARLLGAPLGAYLRPWVEEGRSIGEQLAARGLRPRDIDILLLSHLDADHVGGLHELQGVRRILLPEDEYFWSCRTVYKLRQPRSLWIDMPIERFFYRGSPLGTNRWAWDLFGDESVTVVNLPGHTDGLGAVRVQSGSRFVWLAADAALDRENLRTLRAPGFSFDQTLSQKALAYLSAQERESGCAGVLLSHDREERRAALRL